MSGGAELGSTEECVVSEELAFGCSGISTAIAANNLAVCMFQFRILISNGNSLSHSKPIIMTIF